MRKKPSIEDNTTRLINEYRTAHLPAAIDALRLKLGLISDLGTDDEAIKSLSLERLGQYIEFLTRQITGLENFLVQLAADDQQLKEMANVG